jgi:hypothetical protein
VSYRLVSEVLEHAPAGLTYAERYLLLALAEWSDDHTRTCWYGPEAIMQRMRVDSWDAVAKVFRGLAAKGLEVRVPIATDRRGHPQYAKRGTKTTYRIPPLAASPTKVFART